MDLKLIMQSESAIPLFGLSNDIISPPAKRKRDEYKQAITPQYARAQDHVRHHDYVPPHHLSAALETLTEEETRRILLDAARTSERIANKVLSIYNAKVFAESQRERDFDFFSKIVWREVNPWRNSRWGSDAEDDYAVSQSVERSIGEIQKAVKPHSSFRTKQSGLETLRKICKTICLSDEHSFGEDVQMHFQDNPILETSMLAILECMTEEEKETMRNVNNGEIIAKVRELIDLAKEREILKDMHDVLVVLDPSACENGSSTSSSEGDAESESGRESCACGPGDCTGKCAEDSDAELEGNGATLLRRAGRGALWSDTTFSPRKSYLMKANAGVPVSGRQLPPLGPFESFLKGRPCKRIRATAEDCHGEGCGSCKSCLMILEM